MIRRLLFIITVLCIVSAASLGIRRALHPPVTYMLVPGATQIEVLHFSMGEQVIIYHAPGPAYAWHATVERNLAAHGWARPIRWSMDMPATNTYRHVSSFWFGAIQEAVELEGEPNSARIRVRRWIEFPWQWKRWWLDVSQYL